MATSRHTIRVYIGCPYIVLHVECHSSPDAECMVEGGDGNGGTVCRYIQWWNETEVNLEEFYFGTKVVPLIDGAEISIDWDGEAWVWDLKD